MNPNVIRNARFAHIETASVARAREEVPGHWGFEIEPLHAAAMESADLAYIEPVDAGVLWGSVLHRKRLLPPAVVAKEVAERVAKIEGDRGKRVANRERKRIKDEALARLMPQALIVERSITFHLDLKRRLLVVHAPTTRALQVVSGLLRSSPLAVVTKPVSWLERYPTMLTYWWEGKIAGAPEGFEVGDRFKSRVPETGGTGVSAQTAPGDAVEALRADGHYCIELELTYNESVRFRLDDDLGMRSIKLTDMALESFHAEREGSEERDGDAAAAAEAAAARLLCAARVGEAFDAIAEAWEVETPEWPK